MGADGIGKLLDSRKKGESTTVDSPFLHPPFFFVMKVPYTDGVVVE